MLYTLDAVSIALGDRPILRDLRLSIAPGERIVLLGVNGCGKTTLLKLLDGLAVASQGVIRYQDQTLDANALQDADFRRRFRSEVALLFQNVDAMLFNPTVADEIAFGPRQLALADTDARVARWADQFAVTPFLERPPFELSGGEKKRVALAAIFSIEPKVLLLDEPTESLDPASSARLVDMLAGLDGVTVIASTHNLSLVEELGSRAILIAPGRAGLLFDGPPADLLSNEELLIESGLAHRHVHVHRDARHAHYHLHNGS
jgi:cobalt/nickel transport system ATP-binding protein